MFSSARDVADGGRWLALCICPSYVERSSVSQPYTRYIPASAEMSSV